MRVNLTRRQALGSFMASLAAVAVPLELPTEAPAKVLELVGDGVTDDTEAMQALHDRGEILYLQSGGVYRITKTLVLRGSAGLFGARMLFDLDDDQHVCIRGAPDCRATLMNFSIENRSSRLGAL